MSVVSCNEIQSGRQAWRDWNNVREYTRVWRVIVDSNQDNEVDIDADPAAADIPAQGELHEEGGAYVSRRQFVHSNDFEWIVTITYSSNFRNVGLGVGGNEPGGTGSGGTGSPQTEGNYPANPLLQPARWQFSAQKHQIAVTTDQTTGALVKNTAGEPFADPLTKELGHGRFSVTKNISASLLDTVRIDRWYSCVGKTNSDYHLGWIPYDLKLDDFTVGVDWSENGEKVVTVTQTYLRSPEPQGWAYSRILNVGLNQKNAANPSGPPVPIVRASTYVSYPVLLDEDGYEITPGSTTAPHYVEVDVLDAVPFTSMLPIH